MIAQVVFDLPLEGPFDYLVPEELSSRVTVGCRVKVSFGPRRQTGFVIGLIAKSTIPHLKSILSLPDAEAALNEQDFVFARDFAAYYGCSVGEALGTMTRNKKDLKASVTLQRISKKFLYRLHPDEYILKINEIIKSYPAASRFFILVPDVFKLEKIAQALKRDDIKIATRSGVFECDGRYACVFMVDEEDASFKQEQSPMYDTRQVILKRADIFGFDLAFLGISPSVELMAQALEGQIELINLPLNLPPVRAVDLSNYKFIPGMVSPPLKDALDAALKGLKKSVLVLNRKGSYRLTKCVDCGEILKCHHCDSPLLFSRSAKKFLCRHCTYSLPGDTACPKCHKPSWRSQGMGVEQLQGELKKIFPQARIVAFERSEKLKKGDGPQKSGELSANFDILISTQALLRFEGQWKAQVAALIDFDGEINRLEMRSSFNAYRLLMHVSGMTTGSVFVQTRNRSHYVLEAVGGSRDFYREELNLRKEFGFAPFKHWIKLSLRGKSEKMTQEAAMRAYNTLGEMASVPQADVVGRKRDQFRFNIMMQSDEVPGTMAIIKSKLAALKPKLKVITSLNVDP